ncbi:MAG: hypothetical protein WD176_09865, partial [Pirellulales bacterium]
SAVASVPDGSKVVSTTSAAMGSEIVVQGLGPEFEIVWGDAGSRGEGPAQPVLEATSQVRVAIERATVRWQCDLSVRSLSGPLSTFNVRLPLGAELEDSANANYTVAANTALVPTVATVTPKRPMSEPLSLRLSARLAREPNTAREIVPLAGFEVPGAARQDGFLAVSVDDEWRVDWASQSDVRVAEDLPPSLAGSRDQRVLGFQFYRQPFVLTARITPQTSRITVEPQYFLTVEPDRVVLEAKLGYKSRSGRLGHLEIEMPGWEIDEVGPSGVVRPDFDLVNDGPVLSIPLAARQRAPVDLVVKAHRPLPSRSATVNVVLPKPRADVLRPALVVVDSADNVELTPRNQDLVGLTPHAAAQPPRPLKPQVESYFYRAANGPAASRFVADMAVWPRSVAIEMDSQIAFANADVSNGHGAGASVEQTFAYRVAYEPLDRIELDVPSAIDGQKELSFRIDGTAVAATRITSGRAARLDDASSVRVTLPLAKPLLGAAEVKIRYSLGLHSLGLGRPLKKETALVVPLVTPAEGSVVRNRLGVIGGSDFGIELAPGRWKVADDLGLMARGDLHLTAPEKLGSVGLKLAPRPFQTAVDLVWMQSWFTTDGRQDRAVMRLESSEPEWRVKLPPGVRGEEVRVWLDGQAISAAFHEDASGAELVIDATSAGGRAAPGRVASHSKA